MRGSRLRSRNLNGFLRSGATLAIFFCLSIEAALVCDESVFDFGDREEGETVQHVFTVKNTGTSEVTVGGVRTSCGCTAASLSTNVVRAGEAVEITVSLNLEGRIGTQNKRISVYSSDPKQSEPSEKLLMLQLKGNSRAAVEVAPSSIHFSNVQADRVSGQSILIRSFRPSLRPGEPRCDSLAIRCVLMPGKAENEVILTATLLDSPLSGDSQATISLPVFDGKKTISIPVYIGSGVLPEMAPVPSE